MKAKTKTTWKVGDFVTQKWTTSDDSETNVKFYQVVRVSESNIWLLPVDGQLVSRKGVTVSFIPDGIEDLSENTFGILKMCRGDQIICVKTHSNEQAGAGSWWVWKWDGKPVGCYKPYKNFNKIPIGSVVSGTYGL